jgi:hypothetical protein
MSELVRENITRVQIAKYVTKDRVLDISDMLNIEPKRSKIAFTLLEFDENHKAVSKVRHFADADDFKLVCWDILQNQFAEWSDHKGSPLSGVNTGELQARVLTLRKDVKYRQPYVLKIDNGVGEAMEGGAVKMVQTTETLTLLLPEFEARRIAQTVYDYIRDWEVIQFRKRQEARSVIFTGSETPINPINHAEVPTLMDVPTTTATNRRKNSNSSKVAA